MREIEPPADDLVARAQAQDHVAWTDIYDRFSGSLYSFFLHQVRQKETAEDLTAGVFIEAMGAIRRFEGDVAALRSWIFRIARNNLIDHVRQAKRARFEPIHEANPKEIERAGETTDPEMSALDNLERQRLLEAVESLSPDQREVVMLRLIAGLTSPEIASLTGRTQGAVKALQHRAMIVLAKRLESLRDR